MAETTILDSAAARLSADHDDARSWCAAANADPLREACDGLSLLLAPDSFRVQHGPGGLFGVVDSATGDIIGGGMTALAAVLDAIETAKGWQS